ncbi:hypothetical protein HWV62_11570, partial [Athelia sp. TMB]
MSSEYVPLRADAELATDDGFGESPRGSRSPIYAYSNGTNKESSLSFWLTVIFSVLSISSALALHANIVSADYGTKNWADPRDLATLKKLTPYPNIQTVPKIKHTMGMPYRIFPNQVIRANSGDPERVYNHSNAVTLSSTSYLRQDSTFVHWSADNRAMTLCYIYAVVPSPAALQQSGQSVFSSGDVTRVEVWNVTGPASGPLSALSWSTRPRRVSQLGTANFTYQGNVGVHDAMDGHELKAPFDCSGRFNLTVELACAGCRLEFEQAAPEI